MTMEKQCTALDEFVRRQWTATGPILLGAAAAAAVVAVALTGLTDAGDRAERPDRSADAAAAAPQELGWPQVEGVPDGQQVISYRGVEILVPEAWTIDDMHCGNPARDTVIIEGGSSPGALAMCAVRDPPKVTVVWVDRLDVPVQEHPVARLATEEWTLHGAPVLRGQGSPVFLEGPDPRRLSREVLVLPDQEVVVSVESPDAEEAMRLLMTTRVATVDSAGCPAAVDSLDVIPATRAGAAEQLAPGTPTGASVCRYTDGHLVRSARLGTDQVGELMGVLNAQAEGVGAAHPAEVAHGLGCTEIALEARGFVVHLTYPDGDPAQVLVRVDSCDRQISTNGVRTTVVTQELFGVLAGAVDYDGGTSALPNLDGGIELPFGLQP